MKLITYTSILFILIGLLASCDKKPLEQETVLENFDLHQFDYFEENLPGIYTNGLRVNNRVDELAALGRVLFYDTHLSLNNLISCASCHKQEFAFADDQALSKGLFNKNTTRNSVSLTNPGFIRRFFWDASASNLNDAVSAPIVNHIEMGIHDLSDLPIKLQELDYYKPLFDEVFGGNPENINVANIKVALATFVGSLFSYNSKYDQASETDFISFSAKEKKGQELFNGKANCASCHREPFLQYYGTANIGLEMDYDDPGIQSGIFNIPNLRNVALTPPYMHDGRFNTLLEVIDHYDHGVKDHPDLSWALKRGGNVQRLDLTPNEKENLIAFLETLSDYKYISDPRFSNPF